MQDAVLCRRVDADVVVIAPNDVAVFLDLADRQPKPDQRMPHDRQPSLELGMDHVFGAK